MDLAHHGTGGVRTRGSEGGVPPSWGDTGAKRRRQGARPPGGSGQVLVPATSNPNPSGQPSLKRQLASQGGCSQRKGKIKNHFSSSGWRTSTKGHGILPTGRGLTWSLVRNDGITQPYLVDEPLSLTLPLSYKVLFLAQGKI